MNCLYSKIRHSSWLFETINTLFLCSEIVTGFLVNAWKTTIYQKCNVISKLSITLFSFPYLFVLLLIRIAGIELRALCTLGKHSTTELHPQSSIAHFSIFLFRRMLYYLGSFISCCTLSHELIGNGHQDLRLPHVSSDKM